MCPELLSDARLYALLLKFDEDLFAQTREEGCPCGGALHSASYPRKPRGAQAVLPAGYGRRHSLCCSQDGCRKRRTRIRFTATCGGGVVPGSTCGA
jgi:hypothetical protein